MPKITDNINNDELYYNYCALLITEKRKTIFLCVVPHALRRALQSQSTVLLLICAFR